MTRAARTAWTLWNLPRYLVVGVLRLWRLVVSPLYGPTCKYYPSCSSYALKAVTDHGVVRGLALVAWRILRCNPWSHGGVDDVPPAGEPRLALTRWLRDAAGSVAAGGSPRTDLTDPAGGRSASEPAHVG